MKGETVIVRAYGGVPTVLVIWEESDGAMALSAPDEYRRLDCGEEGALEPVWVQRKDVFRYSEELGALISAGRFSWDLALPYGDSRFR